MIVCKRSRVRNSSSSKRLVKELLASATVALSEVPAVVQCPFAQEDFDDPMVRGPIPLPGGPVFLSGYQYTARLDEVSASLGAALQPARIARAKGNHRGVIWADDVAWYSGSGLAFVPPGAAVWAYFHHKKQPNFKAPGLADTTALRGQHRAWSDGSVEWVPGEMIDLDLTRRDSAASFANGPSGGRFSYYWF